MCGLLQYIVTLWHEFTNLFTQFSISFILFRPIKKLERDQEVFNETVFRGNDMNCVINGYKE